MHYYIISETYITLYTSLIIYIESIYIFSAVELNYHDRPEAGEIVRSNQSGIPFIFTAVYAELVKY